MFDALGRIAPYDWAGFFHTRLTSLAPAPPLDGLTRSGWRLAYDATPNVFIHSGYMLDTVGLQAATPTMRPSAARPARGPTR